MRHEETKCSKRPHVQCGKLHVTFMSLYPGQSLGVVGGLETICICDKDTAYTVSSTCLSHAPGGLAMLQPAGRAQFGMCTQNSCPYRIQAYHTHTSWRLPLLAVVCATRGCAGRGGQDRRHQLRRWCPGSITWSGCCCCCCCDGGGRCWADGGCCFSSGCVAACCCCCCCCCCRCCQLAAVPARHPAQQGVLLQHCHTLLCVPLPLTAAAHTKDRS
jgi:hypothetical protein